MVWRVLWQILGVLVFLSFVVVLFLLFVLFFLPMLCLIWLAQKLSGEGHWCRLQRQRMVLDRPPLDDAEFLEAVHASPEDAPLWLTVRRVMADAIGLSADAIYPEDQTLDLWRMQSIGRDGVDFVFRLEKSLGMKIPNQALGKELFSKAPCEFQEFSAQVVCVLHDLQSKQPTSDTSIRTVEITKG